MSLRVRPRRAFLSQPPTVHQHRVSPWRPATSTSPNSIPLTAARSKVISRGNCLPRTRSGKRISEKPPVLLHPVPHERDEDVVRQHPVHWCMPEFPVRSSGQLPENKHLIIPNAPVLQQG